jgi:hypothetical protein
MLLGSRPKVAKKIKDSARSGGVSVVCIAEQG